MPTLICYDITKNSLRAKLAKKIIAAGLDRVNKSVYLGTIKSSSLTALEQDIVAILATKSNPTDSVIVLPVNGEQIRQMRVYGSNALDKEELTGEKSTLIV